MKLRRADLLMLSKANEEKGTVDFFDRNVVVDPESVHRIQRAGLADAKGVMTENGLKLAKAVMAKLHVLRAGVPFSERKSLMDSRASYYGPWFTGTLSKKAYLTNGYLFMLSRPMKQIDSAEQGSPELRQKVPGMVASSISEKKVVELLPHTWVVFELGVFEVVWLADKDEKVFVPLNVAFMDLVKAKYQSARMYVKAGSKGWDPIQFRVRNRGLKNNVVAIVMPVALDIEEDGPKKRGKDGSKKVQEKGVP